MNEFSNQYLYIKLGAALFWTEENEVNILLIRQGTTIVHNSIGEYHSSGPQQSSDNEWWKMRFINKTAIAENKA